MLYVPNTRKQLRCVACVPLWLRHEKAACLTARQDSRRCAQLAEHCPACVFLTWLKGFMTQKFVFMGRKKGNYCIISCLCTTASTDAVTALDTNRAEISLVQTITLLPSIRGYHSPQELAEVSGLVTDVTAPIRKRAELGQPYISSNLALNRRHRTSVISTSAWRCNRKAI